MCGRVYINATLDELMKSFSFAGKGDVEGLANRFPRYNGAPTQDYPIIISDVFPPAAPNGSLGKDRAAPKFSANAERAKKPYRSPLFHGCPEKKKGPLKRPDQN